MIVLAILFLIVLFYGIYWVITVPASKVKNYVKHNPTWMTYEEYYEEKTKSYPGYTALTPTELNAKEDLKSGDFVYIKGEDVYKATPPVKEKKDSIPDPFYSKKDNTQVEDPSLWFQSLYDHHSTNSSYSASSDHSHSSSCDSSSYSSDSSSFDSSDCSSSD